MKMQQSLPLWDKAVFVDWHGVLSLDPFWKSLDVIDSSRFRSILQFELSQLFSSDSASLDDWMRGNLRVQDVTPAAREALGRRRRWDFLERRFLEDCQQMHVHPELFVQLAALAKDAFVVVATDNAVEFEDAFWAAKGRLRRSDGAPRLIELAAVIDDMICSGTQGVLKAEDPSAFFGPWLAAHDLDFSEALLVDDRSDNCAAFLAAGGHALVWPRGEHEAQAEALGYIGEWSRTRHLRAEARS